jgi:hypothetical protein
MKIRRSAGRISRLKSLKKLIPSRPVDVMAEIGNVHVYVRHGESERGE